MDELLKSFARLSTEMTDIMFEIGSEIVRLKQENQELKERVIKLEDNQDLFEKEIDSLLYRG